MNMDMIKKFVVQGQRVKLVNAKTGELENKGEPFIGNMLYDTLEEANEQRAAMEEKRPHIQYSVRTANIF